VARRKEAIRTFEDLTPAISSVSEDGPDIRHSCFPPIRVSAGGLRPRACRMEASQTSAHRALHRSSGGIAFLRSQILGLRWGELVTGSPDHH
jgi:hypothetical protein